MSFSFLTLLFLEATPYDLWEVEPECPSCCWVMQPSLTSLQVLYKLPEHVVPLFGFWAGSRT